ncbi:hypothetical protein DFH27DRAFT_605210 [Peziza echinospora]|nr:hypothetical protein DFH27DRAFT_605210 [Peziza echinospora]
MSNPKISILPDDPSAPPPPPLPPWKRNGNSPIVGAGVPDILSRISQFLPQLQAANQALQEDISSGKIDEKRIENVGKDEETYIEMNLGLGVFEERKKRNIANLRAKRIKATDNTGAEINTDGTGSSSSKGKGKVDTATDDNDGTTTTTTTSDSESDSDSDTDSDDSDSDSDSDSDDAGDSSDNDSDDDDDDDDDSDSDGEGNDDAASHSDSEMLNGDDLVSAFLRNINNPNPSSSSNNTDGMEIEVLPDLSVRKRKRGGAPVDKGVLGTLMDIEAASGGKEGGGGGSGEGSGSDEAEKTRKPLIEVVEEDDQMRD